MITKKFDSEAFYERLYVFGLDCQKLMKLLPKTNYNTIYSDQLLRSSASVGANYIEALSKKDFLHRLKISRKETRESLHWLRLIKDTNPLVPVVTDEANRFISVGDQIKKIFTSSIMTTEKYMLTSK
jgi:four helix bundle protein